MKSFTFEFTPEETNVLLSGLSELPAKTSFGLITKIQMQAQAQMQNAAAAQNQQSATTEVTENAQP